LAIANNCFNYAMKNFTEDKLVDRVYYVYKNIQSNKTNKIVFY